MAKPDQEAGKDKMSTMKKIAILVVAVLLAGGVGAGVFYFLRHSANAGNAAQNEEEESAAKLYYELGKPLTVNFPRDSSIQVAQISVAFLVAGEETLDSLKKHEPMIRNNLLMLIGSQNAENLILREEKEKLRASMLAEVVSILKKMTGKGQIKELFFTSFITQ